MAVRGFFVRGAVTVGDLHVGDDIVFGPAILEAHLLESTVARDPRVILSPGMMQLVEKHLKYYGDPRESPQNAFIFRDADGQAFLNYLGTTIGEEYEGDVADWATVLKHKEAIEQKLEDFHSVPKIWAKYNWVASYHNYFCDEAAHVQGYDSAYKVSSPYHKTSPMRLISGR
jgi:hypothetical protein